MASVKRGKALVASLRAQPGVRDPEALAATLGRAKKLRKKGVSPKAAIKAASGGGGSSKKRKRKDDSTPENAREIQRLQSRGGIMGLPRGGLGEEANRRERERNKAEGFTPGIKGSDDPKKMSDADLDYFIRANEMSQNVRTPLPGQRQKAADRLIKLWAEKKRRKDRRALGYKY